MGSDSTKDNKGSKGPEVPAPIDPKADSNPLPELRPPEARSQESVPTPPPGSVGAEAAAAGE